MVASTGTLSFEVSGRRLAPDPFLYIRNVTVNEFEQFPRDVSLAIRGDVRVANFSANSGSRKPYGIEHGFAPKTTHDEHAIVHAFGPFVSVTDGHGWKAQNGRFFGDGATV